MPENLIHCQSCRALLNPELESDSVEVPEFMPLQEIESMVDASPNGHYVECPDCHRELRIHDKYAGQRVKCKFCNGGFRHDLTGGSVHVVAVYTSCPHCSQELRAATKYLGLKVACRHCDGKIHLLQK